MSQKNISQLQEHKAKLEADKAKLEAIKTNQPEKWTQQMQVKLDEIIGTIADVEEELVVAVKLDEIIGTIADVEEELVVAVKNEPANEQDEPANEQAYSPAKGTEKLVHLMIVRGRRFNPMTGKEESNPYLQTFTYGEFQLFKNNAHLLGYSVLEVLHDPYNEAHELIVK